MSSGVGLWQSMVARVSGKLNCPWTRPPVVKPPEREPPVSLAMKNGKMRELYHGDEGHLRNIFPRVRPHRRDHWRSRLWETGPPRWVLGSQGRTRFQREMLQKVMRETGPHSSSWYQLYPLTFGGYWDPEKLEPRAGTHMGEERGCSFILCLQLSPDFGTGSHLG